MQQWYLLPLLAVFCTFRVPEEMDEFWARDCVREERHQRSWRPTRHMFAGISDTTDSVVSLSNTYLGLAAAVDRQAERTKRINDMVRMYDNRSLVSSLTHRK